MTTEETTRSTLLLEPGRLLHWVYAGRVALALAIFFAVVFVWPDAVMRTEPLAVGILAATMVCTIASAAWSEIYRRPLTNGFLGTQVLFDLAVVTAVVVITGGASSQFAALYILVIAVAALVLSVSGALLIAALACVLYFAVVMFAKEATLDIGIWLQISVFAGVALSSGYIATRLREARAGHAVLAAELEKVRLQADDILRNIRSGIVTIDSSGTLLYANTAAGTLLGVDFDSRVGESALALIEPVSPALALALERAARKGVRTSRAEGRVSIGARHFPIGLNTTVTSEENGHGNGNGSGNGDGASPPTGWTATAIFQDISDQKRLDTLHMRTQRLEAVAELSASLAHEIKNPLASIRSAVEQIARSPKATSDERTLSELIVRESDRLSRLLSEFLDFSRVRVSRIARIDISAVTRGVANLADTNPGRPEGAHVTFTAPPQPLHIEGDEDLLHRALFNLVLNALQASPCGGEVRVDLSAVAPDEAPPGVTLDRGGVSIRVTDQGPGIPPEIRERLFDPFFTTKPGGSGLGLAIVHRAIESHRGYVFVDSDDGGTRLTVLLPTDQTDGGDHR